MLSNPINSRSKKMSSAVTKISCMEKTIKIFVSWERLLDRFYRLSLDERSQLQTFYNALRNLLILNESEPYSGMKDLPEPADVRRMREFMLSNPLLYENILNIAAKDSLWLRRQLGISEDPPTTATGRRCLTKRKCEKIKQRGTKQT